MNLKNYLMYKMMGMDDQKAMMYSMMGGGNDMLMMLMLMGGFNTNTGSGVTPVNAAGIGSAIGQMLPLLLMSKKRSYRRRSYRRRYSSGGGFMSGFVKGLSAGK